MLVAAIVDEGEIGLLGEGIYAKDQSGGGEEERSAADAVLLDESGYVLIVPFG